MLKYFGMASVGVAILLSSTSAVRADLATSIINGDFEAATFPGGFADLGPAQHPGWTAHEDHDAGALVWHQNLVTITGVPTFSGYAGGLITMPGESSVGPDGGAVEAFSQSLGTVGAGDVGKQFVLSADLGARGFDTHQWESTLLVGFTADLVDFTSLGTPGVLNVVTPLATTPIGMETRSATFTPDAGHVGMEIFALLHVESHTPFTVDQQQHIVDNVGLNIVPEPSAWLLIGVGALLLAGGRRSSRRRQRKMLPKQ